jgi:hypothetical protein
MLLTFEKIREAHLNEKKDGVQPLPEQFFKDCGEYLRSKQGTLEGQNGQRLIKEILMRRAKKIIERAFHNKGAAKNTDDLELQEQEFYAEVISVLEKYSKKLESILGETEKGQGECYCGKDENNLNATTSTMETDVHACGFAREPNVNQKIPPKNLEQNDICGQEKQKGEKKPDISCEWAAPNTDTQYNIPINNLADDIEGLKKIEESSPSACAEKPDRLQVIFVDDTPELMIPGRGPKRYFKGEKLEFEIGLAEFLIQKGFAKKAGPD